MNDKEQCFTELKYKMKPSLNKVLINFDPPESRDKKQFETENTCDILNSDLTSHNQFSLKNIGKFN